MTASEVLATVLLRAEAHSWAGADPYDGLLSPLGRAAIPFGPLPRFAVSQAVLRFPAARWFASPPESVNSKGLALFLGAAVRSRDVLGHGQAADLAERLVYEIDLHKIEAESGIGWGYPFPWQSRAFWAPRGTPNAVATATVGWHLLECADAFDDSSARALGWAAADFLASGLRRVPAGGGIALSYTPRDQTRVVNVAALAARLAARVARDRADAPFRKFALDLAGFVLAAQREDGSWPYACDPGGGWQDSFHTGFILEALLQARGCGIPVPDDAIARGYLAYERFFSADGSARLDLTPHSPLDAHSAAQGVLTYGELARCGASAPIQVAAEARAAAISDWALRELWIPERGVFAYRIAGGRRDERAFTRWVQAWMALALACAAAREARAESAAGGVAARGAGRA